MTKSTDRRAGRLISVPTSKLLLYMSTVFAWEAQIALMLARMAGGIVVPPLLRYTVLALYVVLTVLAVRYGKDDMKRIAASPRRIELTGMQMVLVTFLLLSFSIPATLVAMLLRVHSRFASRNCL